MHSKENHELLRRAIEIWTEKPHIGSADVTLKGFIGVFHATMQAVRESQEGLDKSEMVASLACEPADEPK